MMRFIKALIITLGVLCLIVIGATTIGAVMYFTPVWLVAVGVSIICIGIVAVIFMIAWQEVE